MTRQAKGRGRVTPAGTDPELGAPIEREFPTFRQRNPLVFWVVVIAVLAMVLSTIAVPIAFLLS